MNIRLLLILILLSIYPAVSHAEKPISQPYTQDAGEADLQSHDSYTNSDGKTVHSPSKTYSGNVPAGATAQCRDGSYSFSLHHRGTCSRHGGVAEWL